MRSLNAFVKRDYHLVVPLSVKVGADLRSESRDLMRPTYATNFIGADRTTRTADDSAAQWFDPSYSSRDLIHARFENAGSGGKRRCSCWVDSIACSCSDMRGSSGC